jgi:hypothetical protein
MTIKPHWPNPWPDVIYVPIEELAACYAALGQGCTDIDGSRFVWTVDRVLEHWSQAGDKLDAYILPQPSGWHDIGIRYGSEGHQYLSPGADRERVTALLKRYI